jgi:hypothetical protein
MKKILLTLCMTLGCILSHAQGRTYCELVGTQNLLGKTIVSVDFGQVSLFSDNRMVDENGDVLKFNSMVDAMNYMGALGWEFEQAYVVSHNYGKSSSNVYHWLLSKPYSEDGAGLKTMNMIKQEIKKAKEQEQQEQQEQENDDMYDWMNDVNYQ